MRANDGNGAEPSVTYLVLEDGSVYQGESFGDNSSAHGEVVFNTGMTGYQEALTDPSYAGQIVVLTYPLVGNYGTNSRDVESRQVQVAGFVVREHCDSPSHALSDATLHQFLKERGTPGISGVDTRSITKKLRSHGVMMGMIIPADEVDEVGPETWRQASEDTSARIAEAALARLNDVVPYGEVDYVSRVTTDAPYTWEPGSDRGSRMPRIVVGDYGVKYNILRLLHQRGCDVVTVPCTASAEEVLALEPSGVLLSPGPGNPALLGYMVETVGQLIGRVPLMGICLGHQIVARALGASTFKLKFGHRGANHSVQDVSTGRVYITAQNHGYAVDLDTLPQELEVTHLNLNDGTVEGLRHRSLPVVSI
ncbi:MAG: glutamine-hydrolyzing carbamoyl-phosphate synthase small subunit, partial [Dehalococcoidia bacterium]|nr:glutamine-hydrolyzing carbamoyl-phosphate synthase small subunit [Dehalococcoidia bacterium]